PGAQVRDPAQVADEQPHGQVEGDGQQHQGQGEVAQGPAHELVEEVGDQPPGDQQPGPDVVDLVQGELGVAPVGRLQPVHELRHHIVAGGDVQRVEGVGAPVPAVEGVAVLGDHHDLAGAVG